MQSSSLSNAIVGAGEWKLSEADRMMLQMIPAVMAPMSAESALKRFILIASHFNLDADAMLKFLDRDMRGEHVSR